MLVTIKGNMFSSFLKFSYKQNSALRTWFLTFRLTKKNYFYTTRTWWTKKYMKIILLLIKNPPSRSPKTLGSVDQGVLFRH